MRKLFALLILLIIPVSVGAYASPGAPTGYVNDFARVLSPQAKTELEAMLSSYKEQTDNEISVVTIQRLTDETIESYAVRLFEDWGIGKHGKDNGALFLISVDDRAMRIEVGYGLEQSLTDVESKQIVANVVPPYFRNDDYDEGVRAGVVAMIQSIGADFEAPAAALRTQSNENGGIVWGNFFWFFIFGFMWLGSILSRSRSWWAGGVVGAIFGIIVGATVSWWWSPALIVAGLVFDYLVSTKYKHIFEKGNASAHRWPWIFLIGGGPNRWDKGGRGGFGGFGGGMSGGGGASGRW